MNVKNCIRAAEKNLSDARRYLETGEAINWVPDRLSGALLWAMEAWLMANGYEIDRGLGWGGTRKAFWEAAPSGLSLEVTTCLSRATFLQFDLEGGLDYKEPLPSMDVWHEKAFECLEEAERTLIRIFKDLESARG
jgi:uncharacterized protein (UPF0332 family)